ncbi:anti-sigma factor family protein, partial [Cellulosimicrobium cellulans]|uniref:anti-sigma factor family protein n=1 Tax=Cellulosimicrobium cellulans TaxID=1710 RepID=UPI001495785D
MTATPPPDPYREWDAAYVLGALGPQDRREFERHLATCAACRDSVAGLAGMPGILGMLTPEHATALAGPGPHDGASPDRAAGGAPGDEADVVPLSGLAAGARHRRARR